ncbi:hypothetical protein [Dactylosporangium sp. NPDC000521]|uniref:hypothetical protein n=1 Tax=Dactylosporangium sp. NPDC000521 TaxID=3363975 RepID=UPI003681500D
MRIHDRAWLSHHWYRPRGGTDEHHIDDRRSGSQQRMEVLTDLGLTGQDVARHVTKWVSRLDVLAIRVPATSRA